MWSSIFPSSKESALFFMLLLSLVFLPPNSEINRNCFREDMKKNFRMFSLPSRSFGITAPVKSFFAASLHFTRELVEFFSKKWSTKALSLFATKILRKSHFSGSVPSFTILWSRKTPKKQQGDVWRNFSSSFFRKNKIYVICVVFPLVRLMPMI